MSLVPAVETCAVYLIESSHHWTHCTLLRSILLPFLQPRFLLPLYIRSQTRWNADPTEILLDIGFCPLCHYDGRSMGCSLPLVSRHIHASAVWAIRFQSVVCLSLKRVSSLAFALGNIPSQSCRCTVKYLFVASYHEGPVLTYTYIQQSLLVVADHWPRRFI